MNFTTFGQSEAFHLAVFQMRSFETPSSVFQVSLLSRVPGSGSDSRAAAVEGDMRGVGSEPGQDAIWIAVRKRVDLHCVVGARRHQLAFLWRKEDI